MADERTEIMFIGVFLVKCSCERPHCNRGCSTLNSADSSHEADVVSPAFGLGLFNGGRCD
jgi:hypothetical protein